MRRRAGCGSCSRQVDGKQTARHQGALRTRMLASRLWPKRLFVRAIYVLFVR